MGDRSERSNEIERRRLLDQLADRFSARATVIEAGPGFGKSTLLRQLAGERMEGGPSGGVDASVSIPKRGAGRRELVAAVADAVATATARSRVAGDDIVSAIWAASPDEVCVVVDDAHWLADDAVAALVELSDALPTNGHLLVAMRPDTRGRFSRLFACGSVSVLRDEDLAFDLDERLSFSALHGSSMALDQHSGWPALLELELRTGTTGALRYIISEVVASMDPDTLDACRRLAVLPWIDDRLASGLLGRPTAVELVISGLPLTRSDHGRVELHDLLRTALHVDWSDEEHRAALMAASDVATELGDLDLALDCAARAGDRDGARRVARMLAAELHFGTGSQERLATIAELRSVLGDSIEVDVVEAVNATMHEPGRAASSLGEVLRRAMELGDGEVEALCRLRIADVAYNAADLATLREQSMELDSLAGRGETWAVRTAFLPHVWIMSLTDRPADVVPYLDAHRAGLVAGADPEVEQVIAMYRIWNLAYSGHIRAALDQLRHEPPPPGGLFANRLGGFVLLQRWFLGELTDLDRSEVSSLVDRIGASGQVHLFVEGAASVALFHASAGDVALAESYVHQAEALAYRLAPTAWAHHTIAQARAALLVMSGDEDSAAQVLEAAIPAGGIATLPRHIYGATAALSYLLVPSTREVWDHDAGGPDHELRRCVGRALVALRERGDTALAAALPWDDVSQLRTWAYEPHLVELAVAALDAGVQAAESALDTVVHDPQRVLAELAASGPTGLRKRCASLAMTRPVRPAAPIRIQVLGPIELRRDGRPVDDQAWIRRQRVRDLLALLVDRRSIDRNEAARLMWPDKTTEAAAGNLRFTLSQLVGVLEPEREASRPSWFVRSVGNSLVLDGAGLLSIDVDDFEQRLVDAESAERSGRPVEALAAYLAAADCYQGDYLSGASDAELGYYEALRLRGRFVRAASRASEMLRAIGDLDGAERLVLRAVQAEPMHEVAHRAYAEVLLGQQRLGAARDLIADVIAELRRSGMPPDPRTQRLAQRLGVDAAV